MIAEREQELYRGVWQTVPQYADHSPGEHLVPLFRDMAQAHAGWHTGSVLDAGCGSGKGALALAAAGFRVTCCDLTPDGLVEEARRLPFFPACLWHDLRQHGFRDWVYCTDVLEHVPTALTMLVVARLLAVARKGVFVAMSTEPDAFGVLAGEPLHKTVQPFAWWRDHLGEVGRVAEARDLLNAAAFYVMPR